MFTMSWYSVPVAAASGFLIGGFWYGPLFLRSWQREAGVSDATMQGGNMAVLFGLTLLLNLVSAAMLGHLLSAAGATSLRITLMVSAGIALGFIIPAFGVNYMFSRKSFKLFVIDGGYWLTAYLAMGLVYFLIG